jgi:heterodisulfide reductase subunit A
MDVGRHPNIRLLAYSEVEKVEGDVGDFRITVRKKARYVDESKCTGCGTCAEKCPTVISDEYNLGHANAKAIYKYFAQGIPSTYTIDAAQCRNFQPGKKCGVCAKVCQESHDHKQEDQVLEVRAGRSLLPAMSSMPTGFPSTATRLPNVITALELDGSSRPADLGHVYRMSDLVLKTLCRDRKAQRRRRHWKGSKQFIGLTSSMAATRRESSKGTITISGPSR